eukprot:tig00000492_g1477.t1
MAFSVGVPVQRVSASSSSFLGTGVGRAQEAEQPTRLDAQPRARRHARRAPVAFDIEAAAKKVLVAGASGRVGRLVVEKLRARGAEVRALVRDPAKANFGAGVETVTGDIRQPESAAAATRGVDAVVCAVGPNPQSGGTPKEIDYEGVRNLVDAFAKELRADEKVVAPLGTSGQPVNWGSVNDGVMGGLSESQLVPTGEGASFEGYVSLQNKGGFASVVIKEADERPFDLSGFNGIALRVRGDGQRYKFILKTEDEPEYTWQCPFDTVEGEWIDVRLPFSDFVPTRRNNIVYGSGLRRYGVELDPSRILRFAIMISRFELNLSNNFRFRPGAFRLEMGPIRAYTATPSPTPRFVMVSSAGVMRPQRRAMGDVSAENCIPIVQLSERIGGILRYKLLGENAVRNSGIPYCIVRPVGLGDEAGGERGVELKQGDKATGRVSRDDVAEVAAAALESPAAARKTFEVANYAGAPPTAARLEAAFSSLQADVPEVYIAAAEAYRRV